jgi:hypothetical protein
MQNQTDIRAYKHYANLLVFVHFLWTLFLAVGAIVMIFIPWYAIIQILAMTGTLFLAIPFDNTCPLTLLEEKLRQKVDPRYRNDGSYIATYLNKTLKTKIKTRRVNETLAGLYIIAYALATVMLILRGYGFFTGEK